MQVNPMTAAFDNSASTTSAKDMGDMFMTLLVAQLKTQDPTNPMDPTQFVGQLVQFNSLNELIKIREVLQGVSTSTTSSDIAGGI